MFPDTITVKFVAHARDAHGGDTALPNAGTVFKARVCAITYGNRADMAGIIMDTNHFEVSTPTDPGLHADDLIEWRGHTLAVSARSNNSGGESVRWSTSCTEVN